MPTTIFEGVIQLIGIIGIGGLIGFLGLWKANRKDLKAKIVQETTIKLSLKAAHKRMDEMDSTVGTDHTKTVDDHEHRIRDLENDKIKAAAWRGHVDTALSNIDKAVNMILIRLDP